MRLTYIRLLLIFVKVTFGFGFAPNLDIEQCVASLPFCLDTISVSGQNQEELALGLFGRAFCTNKDLPSCQEFPYVPKEDDESDLKWYCFDSHQRCVTEKAKMMHGEDTVYEYNTKSVWKQIFNEEPLDG